MQLREVKLIDLKINKLIYDDIKNYLIGCKEKYNKAIDEQIEFLDSYPEDANRKSLKKETN